MFICLICSFYHLLVLCLEKRRSDWHQEGRPEEIGMGMLMRYSIKYYVSYKSSNVKKVQLHNRLTSGKKEQGQRLDQTQRQYAFKYSYIHKGLHEIHQKKTNLQVTGNSLSCKDLHKFYNTWNIHVYKVIYFLTTSHIYVYIYN